MHPELQRQLDCLNLTADAPPTPAAWRDLLAALNTSRESAAWHQQAVDHSPNPIFMVDLRGRVRAWNRACTAEFGYESEVAVGEHYGLLHSPGERARLGALLERVLRGEALSGVELRYRCQDGSERVIRIPLSSAPSGTTPAVAPRRGIRIFCPLASARKSS